MPVEKSGQNEFDFQYGEEFGDHIEQFDPDFSKVLVRLNPDGDAEMNERQLERLKRLADWLHEHDRKFLFELLVPAEDEPARAGRRRHRPLRRRAAPRADAPRDRADPGLRHRGRHLEDRGRRRARGRARCWPSRPARARAARTSRACCSGRGASDEKVEHWLQQAARRRGLRRLRHRPLDLVGRAEGLPRRRARARRRPPSRSPTSTCASSASTTTRRSPSGA